MFEWFEIIWNDLIVSFVGTFLNILNQVLSVNFNIEMKDIDINLTLFSDIPIFNMSLYDLLAISLSIFILIFVVSFVYKMFKKMFKLISGGIF